MSTVVPPTGMCLGSACSDALHAAAAAGNDPLSTILIGLAVMVAAAIAGRGAAAALRQPAVLGEVLAGAVLGAVGCWLEWPLAILVRRLDDVQQMFNRAWDGTMPLAQALGEDAMRAAPYASRLEAMLTGEAGSIYVATGTALSVFSSLGIVLLLFVVGVESTLTELLRTGRRAARVAVLGVLAPFLLGAAVCAVLHPAHGLVLNLFVGAALSATSIGLTARVLRDMDRLQTTEAQIILGAAVIDDVLGLLMMSMLATMVVSGGIDAAGAARTVGLATAFLAILVLLGERVLRRALPLLGSIDAPHGRLLVPVILALTAAAAADAVGLAPIVGAFAAGLLLRDQFLPATGDPRPIRERIAPIVELFAPLFFVMLGMQVELAQLADGRTLLAFAGFLAAAVAGKLVSGLAAGRGVSRAAIGVGMLPRGEVGLIFLTMGRALGIVDADLFAALVAVVVVTTIVAPPALRWSFVPSRLQRS